MGIKHPFISPKSDSADTTKVRPTGWNADHVIDGDVNFNGFSALNVNQALVINDPYNATSWDGNLSVPTKDAIRDKIEALVLSGGGVTDFLALTDTPNLYTGKSRAAATVNIAGNALEFKYSTLGIIDVRDYHSGVLASGDDIGPALQAIFDDIDGVGDSVRVRVPHIIGDPGTGNFFTEFDCSPITFPSNCGLVLELNCHRIFTQNTWDMNDGQTIIGLGGSFTGLPHPYSPQPRPSIISTSNPGIKLGDHNCLLENIGVGTSNGPAVQGQLVDLSTIRNCVLTSSNDCALKMDNCFWMLVEHCFLEPGVGNASGPFACELTTEMNSVGNMGLSIFTDIITARHGFYLRSVFGSSGVDTLTFTDVHTESMNPGASTFTFDSSTSNKVGGIHIHNAGNSDALGTTYLIKNIGNNTDGIVLETWNREGIFDPVSTPIKNLVLELHKHNISNDSMPDSLARMTAGSNFSDSHQTRTAGALDARLLTSPVGLPWTIFTPLPCVQNPANWTVTGTSILTTGKLAPDGSLMAAEVNGNSSSGVNCYNVNHNLFIGDYIVYGVWIRNPSGGTINEGSPANSGIEVFGFPATFNVSGNGLANEIEDYIGDNGWRWVCKAHKIRSAGTNPGNISFRLCPNVHIREFFQPCITLIPAATVALLDEVWICNYARSLKGGWSSASTAGNVSLPDHQILQLGAAAGSVTGGLQTNKVITPKAAAKTIAAGVITVTGSYHRVDTEAAAATDDLDTINGGVDGYRLVLLANNVARTIVLKDGTGNLVLAGDISLDNTEDTIELIYDAGLAKWLELSHSNNGA